MAFELPIRPTIEKFARAMEEVLRKYDAARGEDGWKKEDSIYLFRRLGEEMEELLKASQEAWNCKSSPAVFDRVAKEAVDVANFCAFIWEKAMEMSLRYKEGK